MDYRDADMVMDLRYWDYPHLWPAALVALVMALAGWVAA